MIFFFLEQSYQEPVWSIDLFKEPVLFFFLIISIIYLLSLLWISVLASVISFLLFSYHVFCLFQLVFFVNFSVGCLAHIRKAFPFLFPLLPFSPCCGRSPVPWPGVDPSPWQWECRILPSALPGSPPFLFSDIAFNIKYFTKC